MQIASRRRSAPRRKRKESPPARPAPTGDDRAADSPAAVRSLSGGEPSEAEAAIQFDEEWYLYRNRDVARALSEGRGRSALQHYLDHGKGEGRPPLPPPGWDRQKARIEATGQIDPALGEISARHRGEFYLAPVDLAPLGVSELPLNRVAVIGSCLAEAWGFHRNAQSACAVDIITVNNLSSLPPRSADAVKAYDFQIVQLPLRGVLPDSTLWHLAYDDIAGHDSAFEKACQRIDALLQLWMDWNVSYGLLSFVSNF